MVKTPKAGAVKTRLGKEIGIAPATYFYRYMCLNVMRRLSRETRWQTVLAITPETDMYHPLWRLAPRMSQGYGDLGMRMQHVFASLPPGPVVIIGTDIPEIQPKHIAKAFQALGSYDAVFGPADDGGYWLVGQKRCPSILNIFDNVRWSSQYTLEDTLKNLPARNVAMLDVLQDVDTAKEFRDLRSKGARLVLPLPKLI